MINESLDRLLKPLVVFRSIIPEPVSMSASFELYLTKPGFVVVPEELFLQLSVFLAWHRIFGFDSFKHLNFGGQTCILPLFPLLLILFYNLGAPIEHGLGWLY